MELREYDSTRDRDAALAILRGMLARDVPGTPHPGEWDWWIYHKDPRHEILSLIGADALAEIGFDTGDVTAFGLTVDECLALGREHLAGQHFTVSSISVHDTERVEALRAAGFAIDGEPMPLFSRSTAGAHAGAVDGFEIRPLAGESEADARADAARLAFNSTLDIDAHRARYRSFMRSPAYVRERDIVAVDAATGAIAAFAIHWVDEELSLAQFEPVGTHPDYQRRGLARAVLLDSIARLNTRGIETVRVMTGGANVAARAAYESAGFVLVDEIASFRSAPSEA